MLSAEREMAIREYSQRTYIGDVANPIKELLAELDRVRSDNMIAEIEIKKLHYHSAAQLPLMKEGSLTDSYHRGEVRAYEIVLTLLDNLRADKPIDNCFGIPPMSYEGEAEKLKQGKPSMLMDPEKPIDEWTQTLRGELE